MKKILKKYRAVLCAAVTLGCCFMPCAAVSADADALERGSAGDEVVLVQQRLFDLGYVQFRATGKYGEMTYQGVAEFQRTNGVDVDGHLGSDTFEMLFSPEAKRATINGEITRTVGAGLMATATSFGRAEEWGDVKDKLSVGTTVVVKDFNTLAQFSVKRTGGENHADVVPSDAESVETLTKCFGGGETWEKRPVLVTIDGVLCAASLFGSKNADGSYCLYFAGSGSDIGGAPDAEHEAMIAVAAGL